MGRENPLKQLILYKYTVLEIPIPTFLKVIAKLAKIYSIPMQFA